MSRKLLILGSLLLICSSPAPAAESYRYAYVTFVEGELSVQRAAEPEPEAGSINMPVLPGDRVWTHAGSRAEVRLNGASRLRLDASTKVDFVDLDSETIVRLWNGAAILKLTEAEGSVRIDSPAGSIRPTMAGTYRVDVQGVEEGSRVTLSVAQGAAELASTAGAVMVESGQTSHIVSGEAPDIARAFNTASLDEFDAWSDRRDQGASIVRNLGGRSVPYEVESHVSDLSSYGSWESDSVYGTVWYPSVSAGWSPYSNGRWCYTRFGYTWASFEPWGWAPYHYGRWGYHPRGWYWIPGSVWSPAWVSFAVGPYWVGWSPLGFHNRSVFGFDSHFRGHGHRRFAKPGHPWGGDRGTGWSFASRDHFRGRSRDMRRLDDDLIRDTAPRARLFESGAVLDRDLTPRGSRESSGDSSGALRFGERRSESGRRARIDSGPSTGNRTETSSMPRAFTAPRENARGRTAADRPSSRTIPGSPWIRSRANDSDLRSGRSSEGNVSSERRDGFRDRSAVGRRSGTEPPRANVVPPRGNAQGPSRQSATPTPSWRSMGRSGSSDPRGGQRQSLDRGGSRPSSSSWSSPSSSRSSGRAASPRGSSRGSDRGGGGGGGARTSSGGRSRSGRN
jgi:hypothetical protein